MRREYVSLAVHSALRVLRSPGVRPLRSKVDLPQCRVVLAARDDAEGWLAVVISPDTRKLLAVATPRPWDVDWNGPLTAFHSSDGSGRYIGRTERVPDAALIVAAVNDYEQLLRERDTLKEALRAAILGLELAVKAHAAIVMDTPEDEDAKAQVVATMNLCLAHALAALSSPVAEEEEAE